MANHLINFLTATSGSESALTRVEAAHQGSRDMLLQVVRNSNRLVPEGLAKALNNRET